MDDQSSEKPTVAPVEKSGESSNATHESSKSSGAGPSDGGEKAGNPPKAQLVERIQRASRAAVSKFVNSLPKRKPGQRGPDRAPRAPRAPKAPEVALAGAVGASVDSGKAPEVLAGGPAPVPLGESPAQNAVAGIPGGPSVPALAVAPFDRETTESVIEVGVGLINDAGQALVSAEATRAFGDKGFSVECGKKARMNSGTEKAIRLGSLLCAEKYAVDVKKSPEAILISGLALYAGQIAALIKAMRAEGAKLRAAREKATEPTPAAS